jgi:hypothetical protein
MSFIVVAFIYPLLLAALSLGAGLVVEALSGFRLQAALLPACGFAALLVVSQFTVLSPAIAPASPWILVAVAILGFALGRHSLHIRWSNRGRHWWIVPAAGAASYLTVALPLIAAGRLTFPGYLLDTTAGFHLAVGDWILHHGTTLPPSYPAFGTAIHDYFGNGYPAGGQVLVAVTAVLSGQSGLWLYFPFQVFALALSALVLTDLAERAGLPRVAAGFTGWIAAAPALVTAYAQMGSIKELSALPALLLMGVVVVHAREHARAGIRGAIPFAVAGSAAIATLGPAAVAWIGVFAVGSLLVALPTLAGRQVRIPRIDSRALITLSAAAGTLIVFLVVFSIPAVARLNSTLQTAISINGSSPAFAADPGNLVRPLLWVQAFGVWLGGSHRVDPQHVNATYALIGITALAFVLGVTWLLRRRRWSILAFLLGSLLVWFVLTKRGTEWTDAKVLMLTSPVVVAIALIGAFGDFRANRVQSLLLAGAIGVGVLASDALLYHGTNLAPTARFSELLSVGQRFSGQGPTLVPDFDEYAFYALRAMKIDGPGFANDMRGPFAVFNGGPGYGHSYDVDSIEAPDVQRFRWIVTRRSPRWSRPPGNFQLVWSGTYYDVWRRVAPAPLLHIPAGGGLQAVGTLSCNTIHRVSSQAIKDGGVLRYAWRPANLLANLASLAHSPTVVPVADYSGLPSLTFTAPGTVMGKILVPKSGAYGLWMGGSVDRPIRVSIDSRLVGAPAEQSGGDGNVIRVASVRLAAGPHSISLTRGGGSIAPGDAAGNQIDGVFLQRLGAERERVLTLRPQAWRSLCGQALDWLEIA